jgi:hypothetical protein
MHPGRGAEDVEELERNGEKRTKRKQNVEPIAPIRIVSRRPIVDANAPPATEPSGIVPQTTNRREAVMRPRIRSGTTACT